MKRSSPRWLHRQGGLLGLLLLAASAHGEPTAERIAAERAVCGACHAPDHGPDVLSTSAHRELRCVACHTDITETPHRSVLRVPLFRSEMPDGRGQPLDEDGVPLPRVGAGLRISERAADRRGMAEISCASCHAEEASRWSTDVHGVAFARGEPAAPGCVSCHGDHDVPPPGAMDSVQRAARVPRNCAEQCHEGAWRVTRDPDDPLGSDRSEPARSYEDSIHGKKLRTGHERTAVCTSCHGFHGVLPASHPDSLLAPHNAGRSCSGDGACHVGADADFARSFHHRGEDPEREPWIARIRAFFTANGILVLALALADVCFDLRGRWRRR